MTKIALVTCATYPGLSESDRRYAEALTRLGADVVETNWQEGVGALRDADLVVLRSTWDYHQDIGAYRVWLDDLERDCVRVANPVSLVRWNLEKSYLSGLIAAEIRAPAQFIVPRDLEAVRTTIETAAWPQAVIKPAVGASGHGVKLVTPETLDVLWPEIEETTAPHSLVAQAFVPEIREHGQYSFVFFNGRFSHAVRFIPPEGEFRINAHWGPTIEVINPHPDEIGEAAHVVEVLPSRPLYARIDMVPHTGGLLLLEAEVHEPGLLFQFVSEAANTFAESTMRWLHTTHGE